MSHPAYNRTNWVNDQDPPISAQNLNNMEQGILNANQAITTILQNGVVNNALEQRIALLEQKVASLESGGGSKIVLWEKNATQPTSKHGEVVIRYEP